MLYTITPEAHSDKADTINGVLKALQHMYLFHGGVGVDRLCDNIINACSTTNVSGVSAAVHSLIFDHNGYAMRDIVMGVSSNYVSNLNRYQYYTFTSKQVIRLSGNRDLTIA